MPFELMQNFITPPATPRLPEARRAEGIYIWDADGRRYIDGSSGAVCCTLGHGNRRVIEAIRAQHDLVAFSYARAWSNGAESGLVERLARLSGLGLDSAFFVCGGSEAVEASMKFARQLALARGRSTRWKVISRMPSYHGNTLGALSVTGDEQLHALYSPMLVRQPKIPAPFTYRIPDGYNCDTYAAFCAAELERTILAEGPDTVLAFIFEPIGGTATGALVAPDRYYEDVARICRRHGVLLILDEVMSCAGRSGPFLAAHHWPACQPDIVALAKGLSSGYAPLGALLTKSTLVEEVRSSGGFAHGHTYAANPVSCAAGCAVLDELVDQDLMRRCAHRGEQLREALERLKRSNPLVGDVRGRGLQLAVEIVANPETKALLPTESGGVERLRTHCAAEGLVLLTRRTSGGKFGEWLMCSPPLIIDAQQVDDVVQAFSRGLAAFQSELTRQNPGLLP